MGKRLESFEAVQKSTVRIKDQAGKTWGTGFFVTDKGHLLTCAHVVEDAGGWENVRVLDQPVSCIYEGDSQRNDFSVLLVEDIPVISAPIDADFEPGDEFLSPGFSNNDFYGAPIRGEITAFARCGKLGNQKLIRLETFSDAQRIEGGQSGAPIFVYKKGKYKAVGLIVASEDLNGGLAISLSTIWLSGALPKNLKYNSIFIDKKLIALALFGFAFGLSNLLVFFFTKFIVNYDQCSPDKIFNKNQILKEQAEVDIDTALSDVEKFLDQCRNNPKLLASKGILLMNKKQYSAASDTLRKSLNIENKEEVRYNLATAYLNSKKYVEAIEEFKKIENYRRFNVLIQYNMGICYKEKGELKQALEKLEPLIENPPAAANNNIYSDSLYYLLDITASLWYDKRVTSEAVVFQEKYIYYYKLYFDTLDLDKQKNLLAEMSKDIARSQSTVDLRYSVIYSSPKYKKLVSDLHQKASIKTPNN
jgi:tetratricopeptide (TPR) repeat protein